MLEFLIKRPDGAFFNVEEELLGAVLTPTSVPSEIVGGWGNHRIRVADAEISFSLEDVGIQITFDGEISTELALSIAEEIRSNVERATGQHASLVEI